MLRGACECELLAVCRCVPRSGGDIGSEPRRPESAGAPGPMEPPPSAAVVRARTSCGRPAQQQTRVRRRRAWRAHGRPAVACGAVWRRGGVCPGWACAGPNSAKHGHVGRDVGQSWARYGWPIQVPHLASIALTHGYRARPPLARCVVGEDNPPRTCVWEGCPAPIP